jgi:hypothetical protein
MIPERTRKNKVTAIYNEAIVSSATLHSFVLSVGEKYVTQGFPKADGSPEPKGIQQDHRREIHEKTCASDKAKAAESCGFGKAIKEAQEATWRRELR